MRVLLNVAPLQTDVARLLLERLPEFCDDTSEEEREVPQLILGQFRWWVVAEAIQQHQPQCVQSCTLQVSFNAPGKYSPARQSLAPYGQCCGSG